MIVVICGTCRTLQMYEMTVEPMFNRGGTAQWKLSCGVCKSMTMMGAIPVQFVNQDDWNKLTPWRNNK